MELLHVVYTDRYNFGAQTREYGDSKEQEEGSEE